MRLERTSRPPVSSAPTCSSTRTASRSTTCGRSSSGAGGKGNRRRLPRLLLVLVTICRTWEAAGISFALAHAYISFDIHLKRDPSSRRPGEDSQSFKTPIWPDRCRSWAQAEVISRIGLFRFLQKAKKSIWGKYASCCILTRDSPILSLWTQLPAEWQLGCRKRVEDTKLRSRRHDSIAYLLCCRAWWPIKCYSRDL